MHVQEEKLLKGICEQLKHLCIVSQCIHDLSSFFDQGELWGEEGGEGVVVAVAEAVKCLLCPHLCSNGLVLMSHARR